MRTRTLLLCAALAAPLSLQGQTDTLSLDGRKAITLGLGLTGSRRTTASGSVAATHTDGQVGSVSYSQYVRPQLAIEIEAAVLNADTYADPSHAHTNAITPILFGIAIAPSALAITRNVRPFVSAAAGPYVHSVNDASTSGSASTSTETVAGARLATGVNWYAARHFLVSVAGIYHAVGEFDHPDAATDKVSGFSLSLGLGFVWGGK